MMEVMQANWILLVVALLIGVAVAWWVFVASRKTTVRREERPEEETPARRNQALIDSAPAAAPPAVQPTPVEPVPEPLPASGAEAIVAPAPAAGDAADDLTRIKGLGPKLKALLGTLGVTRFAQIAAWDEAEIDRIDAQLGNFSGRIRRDNWVEQARFLAAGDTAGYEGRFGKL